MDVEIRLSFIVLSMVCIVPAVLCIAAFSRPLIQRFGEFVQLDRWRIFFGATPSLLLLGLFYSLAWHMHRSLSGWRHGIGEREFLPSLLAHTRIVGVFYGVVLLATLFIWPVAFIVCGLYRPWRRWTAYLIIHVLCFVLCVFLMSLAPLPFLDWWVD